MHQFLEYIARHPYLAGGAVLAALAVAINELRESMQAFAALSTLQTVRLMNQGALLVDLRSAEAYAAGHIGEARHVPAAELAAQAESLARWRDKNVILYCDSGVTGAAAARTLTKAGFTKVFNLEGGVAAWSKDNLPLVKSPAARKGGAK